ncbi:MAG: TIM barrel protein [Oligoflexus sp.]|nr:TIM barrel protein [Pseudopedobacter sp.]
MTKRRDVIKTIVASSALAGTSALFSSFKNFIPLDNSLKGNINHSVCRWTYSFLSLDELCQLCKDIGIKAIDLVGPSDWETLQKYGIYSSMCNGAEINLVDGFAEIKFHEQLIKNYTKMIPMVAKAGYKNLICFSGNRKGMDDETGLKNCTEGLNKLMALAEKNGVTLVMELLNSKINHHDYFADKTPWGVELCKRVGSNNFKLLYDIYHMQIDEGDVIRTIQTSHPYIAHYHTGGVPGRNEINESQELFYPAIMSAIHQTGFKGYVAQEFIPKNENKKASLAEAIKICDI